MRNKYWIGEYESRGQVVAGGGGRLATVVSIPGRQVFTFRVAHTNSSIAMDGFVVRKFTSD